MSEHDNKIFNLLARERKLNEIGMALSIERNTEKLLEKILVGAKSLTHADGGTVYTVTPDKKLAFRIVWTDSLDYRLGGSAGTPIPFDDLPLFLTDGSPNDKVIAACAVNNKKTVAVIDAYHEAGFDFSGARNFDAKTGYKTKAVLCVPIKTEEDEVIAALQLINPIDPESKQMHSFTEEDKQVVQSLASQAGVALSNQRLLVELKSLFESFIQSLAEAVDEKSPSTGGHGKRVPIISQLLAEAVNKFQEGPFKEIHYSEAELYELKVATFLHDCGKVTTPVHVMEKSKKLETVWDRMHLVDARFEVLKREAFIELLEKKLSWAKKHVPHLFLKANEDMAHFESEYAKVLGQLNADQQFLSRCDVGAEPITEEAHERIKKIGEQEWKLHERFEPFLTPDEIENLSIAKGNLTTQERNILQNHVVMTIRMLSKLAYPKKLRKVPDIAGAHHERVDGRGYPNGLKRDEMPIRARILSIADVFEALSAPDRPYKQPLKLSKILNIMQQMCDEGHLDPDLFDIFVKQKVYLEYGKDHLTADQLDIS